MDLTKIFVIRKREDIILYLQNHFMAVHAYTMSSYLQNLIDSSKIKKIWIDFHLCKYIDSTTIGVLIYLRNTLKDHGDDLILCNLTPEVKVIMENMSLLDYFIIIENEEIKNINFNLSTPIPTENVKISPEFILQAHNNIINIVPEKEKEFETLFAILKKEIQQKKGQV